MQTLDSEEEKINLGKPVCCECSWDGMHIAILHRETGKCSILQTSPTFREKNSFIVSGRWSRVLWSLDGGAIMFFNIGGWATYMRATIYDIHGRCLLTPTKIKFNYEPFFAFVVHSP